MNATVTDDDATVYVYWYAGTPYATVAAIVEDRHWLVMFTLDGVMETAYVIENPDRYLAKPEFEKLGSVSEVLA